MLFQQEIFNFNIPSGHLQKLEAKLSALRVTSFKLYYHKWNTIFVLMIYLIHTVSVPGKGGGNSEHFVWLWESILGERKEWCRQIVFVSHCSVPSQNVWMITQPFDWSQNKKLVNRWDRSRCASLECRLATDFLCCCQEQKTSPINSVCKLILTFDVMVHLLSISFKWNSADQPSF